VLPPVNASQLLWRIRNATTLDDLAAQLQHPPSLHAEHAAAALHVLSAIVGRIVKGAVGVKPMPQEDYVRARNLLEHITHLATPRVPQYTLPELSSTMVTLGQVPRGGCRGHLLCKGTVPGSQQMFRHSISAGWKFHTSSLVPCLNFHSY
jgi:hypothetical protein